MEDGSNREPKLRRGPAESQEEWAITPYVVKNLEGGFRYRLSWAHGRTKKRTPCTWWRPARSRWNLNFRGFSLAWHHRRCWDSQRFGPSRPQNGGRHAEPSPSWSDRQHEITTINLAAFIKRFLDVLFGNFEDDEWEFAIVVANCWCQLSGSHHWLSSVSGLSRYPLLRNSE